MNECNTSSCLGNEKKSSVLHLLPCNIHHDGPAPVTTYFHVKHVTKTETSDKEYYISNFRGRRLEGVNIQLPNNTVGYIVHANRSQNSLEVHSSFDSFTVWEHDHVPPEDVLDKSLEYFDIADIVSCCCMNKLSTLFSNLFFFIRFIRIEDICSNGS